MVNNKRGQMELPFQLIFSIILIAVFIYAAFYGINYFLQRSQQAQIGSFLVDLKARVFETWQMTEGSNVYSFALPTSIKKVCFSNFNLLRYNSSECREFENYRELARQKGDNLFFCPPEKAYNVGAPIEYRIDCDGNDCVDFSRQPYCVQNNDGTLKIRLEKTLGQPNVRLS